MRKRGGSKRREEKKEKEKKRGERRGINEQRKEERKEAILTDQSRKDNLRTVSLFCQFYCLLS